MSFFNGYSTFGGQSNNNNNNSNGSSTSPNRKSVWGSSHSPFRSTNMTLQDITIDQTLPCVNNGRSPGKSAAASNAPGLSTARIAPSIIQGPGGRTMKEYEDQLGTLKKENFNLKLRIYFLEERMGIASADKDAIKKNIELKVEVESLRKELAEKQDLLNQAAKAFELIEEQKETSNRNQTEYKQSLEAERERITELEKELEECRDKLADTSTYYKEAFGITPEESLDNKEKLKKIEELVATLEVEVKQLTNSLEEERSWALDLERERDELKERIESEIKSKDELLEEKNREILSLRDKFREFEEQIFKLESLSQQQKSELLDKERIVKEKNFAIEERVKLYEELYNQCEKKKKQIDSLRNSIKAKEDALMELTNKNKSILSQFENNPLKIRGSSPPGSPNLDPESQKLISMGQKSGCLRSPDKRETPFDWQPKKERSFKVCTQQGRSAGEDYFSRDSDDEAKKQLTLKLCNAQKSAEAYDQKLKKLTAEHEKAIKVIQGFVERQEQLEDKILKRERKIVELEVELSRPRAQENSKNNRPRGARDLANEIASDDPERDQCNQQRFDEMEIKINDLRMQIDTIKAEKSKLEIQIQSESEKVGEQLKIREEKIESLESERNTMRIELSDKMIELEKLKEAYNEASIKKIPTADPEVEDKNLREELASKNAEIEEKDKRIEQLAKELQIRTQNLQKLVNTELWSKNKEIAKLHNHMTATHGGARNRSELSLDGGSGAQVSSLVKELLDVGVQVKTLNDAVQLSFVDNGETVDLNGMKRQAEKLAAQRDELEKEIDYLKWLKLVSTPDSGGSDLLESSGSESERARKYCELLRTHLKELVRFMKEMLRRANRSETISKEHKKIVLDVFIDSEILPEDYIKENRCDNESPEPQRRSRDSIGRKSHSENFIDGKKNFQSNLSDSEAFSEPDRTVSLARIGLRELQRKSNNNNKRISKYTKKSYSDSEDSADHNLRQRNYSHSEPNQFDPADHILELKETNNLLYSELNALRNEIERKSLFDDRFDEKLVPLISKLERSQRFCERLENSLDKRMQECYALKKESKRNNARRFELEKKITEVETMAIELTNQKAEILKSKDNADRQNCEMLASLNRENDTLRTKIHKMEEDIDNAKKSLALITKEMDQLTLAHSQILVENTKLTNEKLRLEQEARKNDSRYDVALRSMQEKFTKEIADLNQVNDSHRLRMQELELINKELRRHVVACEASDSAPSSSGISSIPTDTTIKQGCDEMIQEYHSYNGSQYWLPINYPNLTGRSKSSCSPDLGIESDAALTINRPLKDTLKITESMTNLLSEDENFNNSSRELRDLDSESPLPTEGLNEMEVLKQENEALKRRLMKTRRALEDTFQHLSASNKNKKNVEKAITKQLMITKTILKKTRTYEEPFDN